MAPTEQIHIEIEGIERELTRAAIKEVRDAHRVPAVLYGPEVEENVHFSVDELELEKLLKRRQTKLQDLTINGKTYKTLLKRVEFHPVTDKPLHADFYALAENHKVTLRVPIQLIGTARGIIEQGGRLFTPMSFMRIRVLPKNIPAEFEVDISELKIGDALHVSDLDLDGIIPIDSLSRTIVTIRPPKGTLLSEVEEGEGEEGEGEGTEGGDAAAPAAEGAEATEAPTEE